ncbi:MAG: nitrilase-related carbon-nitrogen hydrolase [Chitinophagales bacterium]
MQNDLNIAIIQTDLIWKDKQANLSNFKDLIKTIQKKVDIIVLPELFNTAFCIDDMNLAEDENGETIAFMKAISVEKNCAVCGSIIFKEDDKIYNRFLFVHENKIRHHYNKHYLFSLVGEDQFLTKGNDKTIIHFLGWKIQPFICYDIRFPAWCQNNDNADVQMYVASWPQKRIHHWKLLLAARATENQCYVIGANRIGTDFFGNEHNGCSAVFDFAGKEITIMEDKNGIEIITLSKTEIEKHKERYPFWKDR